MLRFGLAVSLCLAVSAFAQSTKPTTQPVDTAAVAKLIGELGNDDAGVRDAAREKLAAMGPAISPEVQKAIESTSDPEVRTSLQTLMAELVRADRSKPTLITLHVKNGSPRAAIEKVAAGSGATIGVWPDWVWKNMKRTVTIDADNQPFWIVMMDLCGQAGLSPETNGFGGASRITLNESQPYKPIAMCFESGFLIIPRSAGRSHSIDYNHPATKNESFSVGLRVLVDPKVRVLRGPYEVVVTEATDDKGNSLKAGPTSIADDNLRAPSFGCTWMWDVSAHLRYLPTQGSKLTSLKTTIPFFIADKEEVWEIPLADAKDASKSFTGVTYTINQLDKDGQNYHMKFTITYRERLWNNRGPHENPLTDHQSIQSALKLVDADGRPYLSQGMGGGGGGGKLTYETTFRQPDDEKVGEAQKLIWTVPVGVKRVDIPAEFKDLPIP